MRELVASIEKEYLRYKKYGEGTFDQLADEQLAAVLATDANSIAVIVWHVAGNLKSRFTDFLTTDGEKPWRQRESEFDARHVGRDELLAKWESGFSVLLGALGQLSDADLGKRVTIRSESMAVHEALHRSLAHTASHVGQIVFLGKALKGSDWRTLSIPRQRPS